MSDDFKCPFKGDVDIVCDFRGIKPRDGLKQCPTDIFNKCQKDFYYRYLGNQSRVEGIILATQEQLNMDQGRLLEDL